MNKNSKSKKHLVLEALYQHCKEQDDLRFHNDLVKEVSQQSSFGNPFDATKLDSSVFCI